MAFKRVGSLISSSVVRSKSPDAILALRIRQIAKEAIKRELFDFPDDLIASIKVKSFKNGVLAVSCQPIVAAELKMRSGGLRESINRELGGKIVKGLRFRV